MFASGIWTLAILSGTLLVAVGAKFTEGAWVVVLALPAFIRSEPVIVLIPWRCPTGCVTGSCTTTST